MNGYNVVMMNSVVTHGQNKRSNVGAKINLLTNLGIVLMMVMIANAKVDMLHMVLNLMQTTNPIHSSNLLSNLLLLMELVAKLVFNALHQVLTVQILYQMDKKHASVI